MSEMKSKTPIVDKEVEYILEAYDKHYCLDEVPLVRSRIAKSLELELNRAKEKIRHFEMIAQQIQLKLDDFKAL